MTPSPIPDEPTKDHAAPNKGDNMQSVWILTSPTYNEGSEIVGVFIERWDANWAMQTMTPPVADGKITEHRVEIVRPCGCGEGMIGYHDCKGGVEHIGVHDRLPSCTLVDDRGEALDFEKLRDNWIDDLTPAQHGQMVVCEGGNGHFAVPAHERTEFCFGAIPVTVSDDGLSYKVVAPVAEQPARDERQAELHEDCTIDRTRHNCSCHISAPCQSCEECPALNPFAAPVVEQPVSAECSCGFDYQDEVCPKHGKTPAEWQSDVEQLRASLTASEATITDAIKACDEIINFEPLAGGAELKNPTPIHAAMLASQKMTAMALRSILNTPTSEAVTE